MTGGRNRHVRISIVVVAYNMLRELKRTLYSLSAHYQRNISENEYEVIVVDNGSRPCLNENFVKGYGENFRLLSYAVPSVSPAGALNFGVGHALGDMVVLMIDGARMLSPGCLFWTAFALKQIEAPVVIVPSWHVGPTIQNLSIMEGYDQMAEDILFASIPWREDGYRLFDISHELDPSSQAAGWFKPAAEANFIGVTRRIFEESGGYEIRFSSKGGGAVNLDFFRRMCERTDTNVVSLLGEGTFHQYHGGVTTNASVEDHPWEQIHDEYKSIRGYDFKRPVYNPVVIGIYSDRVSRILSSSASGKLF